MKFNIASDQRLTELGRMGAYLFLGGPIFGGIGAYWLASETAKLSRTYLADSANIFAPSVLMAASGLAFLAGCICLLVGRSQTHHVTVIEPKSGNTTATEDKYALANNWQK